MQGRLQVLALSFALSAPIAQAKGEEGESSAPAEKAAPGDGGSAAASTTAAPGAPIMGPSAKQHVIFLEAGFRQDLGNFSRQEVVGENIQTFRDDVDTLGAMFHVGFFESIVDRVRLGGAFGYGGNYNVSGNDLLGQLLTGDMRVELSIPATPKWAFFLTPRIGVSMIIPAGLLADRIYENQLAGYDTWSGPRFGFLAGADLGSRYGLTDWLSLRASVGYSWFIMLLLNSHASDGTISAAQSWTLQASRISGNLGLEVGF